jgi:hypothetical protein
MRFGMGTRRAALDGLARILDAGELEELFTGSDEDALFVYDLLVEVARGRSSACYWEICRTARRRGVSPEYVSDRAVVLLSSIEERRRIDAYRILGVEGLASAEVIRHRWLEFAKQGHPDVGGDPARFRRVKEAYELLRDPQRRSEYERYWLRALGPFERVVPRDGDLEPPVVRDGNGDRRLAMVAKRGPLAEGGDRAAANGNGPSAVPVPVAEEPAAIEPTVVEGPAAHPLRLAETLARVRGIVRDIDADELAAARARVAHEIERVEALGAMFGELARLKARTTPLG